KTTLLRLIAGELSPTEGAVTRAGSIGVLRQAVQAAPNATVADGLGVAGPLQRLDRLERGAGTTEDAEDADWTLPGRIDAALAGAGLPALEPDRLVATLSGGQRTRLALAALVLAEPDIILLDEPTNNLDADG